MYSMLHDDVFKNEKEARKKNVILLSVNLVLLFSMLLYGINYTIMKYYIQINGSVYIFIILRTVLTIPIIIYIYVTKKPKNENKKLLHVNKMASIEKRTKKKQVIGKNNDGIELNGKFLDKCNKCDKCDYYTKDGNSENIHRYNYMKDDDYSYEILCESCKFCDSTEDLNNSYLRKITKNDEKLIPKGACIPLIILLVSGALRQVIVIIALQFTDSHNVGIIQPTIPIFTAILSHYLKIENLNYITSLSIVLSFIGLSITAELWNAHTFDFGFLLLLTVPITKGLQVIYINKASNYVSNNIIQFFQMIGLLFIALPFGILGEILIKKQYNIINELYNLNIRHFLCILYSTIAIILICWKIQIIALNYLTPTTVSLYQSFQPFFTFILARMFLNEAISLNKIIGTIIIVISLCLYQYGYCKRVKG